MACTLCHAITPKDNDFTIPILVAGSAVVLRLHWYRHIRKVILPAGLAALLYRAIYSPDAESLLTILTQFVSSLNGKRVSLIQGDILGFMLGFAVVKSLSYASTHRPETVVGDLMNAIFDFVKSNPLVQRELKKERAKMEEVMEHDLKSKVRAMGHQMLALPKTGMASDEIIAFVSSLIKKEDGIWENGRVSGAVYHGDRDHQNLLNAAFSLYSLANPLHPDMWPSSTKLEAEIIAMTASIMTSTVKTVCGSTTSGGTESIMLATKTHREYFRSKYGITEPEIVACTTAHAAIDKACGLLGIRLIKVPMDPNTFKCDMVAMHAAIGPNTIMLYGSAPQYPHGVIDDIAGMSELAVRYNIGLHVDLCLGGFFLPFAKKLGHNIPDFDFDLPGVTSMSVDTHKFGYALKGTSVVLYRHPDLRRSQYFGYPKWPGGLYTTPAIAGSRSSGMIAQCWASMVRLGEDGYMRHTRDILESVRLIADGLTRIKELKVIGQSQAMIVCFQSADNNKLNIYAVGDAMSKKGWTLNLVQYPPGIHFCCTVQTVGREQEFLTELDECVKILMLSGASALAGHAAIYGVATALPSGPVEEIMKAYHDVVYKV